MSGGVQDPLLAHLRADLDNESRNTARTSSGLFSPKSGKLRRVGSGSPSQPTVMGESTPLLLDEQGDFYGDDDEEAMFGPPARTAQKKSTARRRRWQCSGGCRRVSCWMYAVLAVLLLLGGAALLTWFVLLPQYARHELVRAQLQVHQVRMDHMSNDGFQLWMNYSLTELPSSYRTRVSTMETVVLYNQTAMGRMVMPEFEIEAGQEQISLQVATQFEIADEIHWIAFVKDMLNRPSFTWDLHGRVGLRLEDTPIGAIHLERIYFEKSLQLAGMDGLKQIQIQNLDLPANLNWDPRAPNAVDPTKELQGIELRVETSIVNPSAIAANMGDITLAVRFDPTSPNLEQPPNPIDWNRGCTLGLLVARNLSLVPGENIVKLRGALLNPESMPELNPGISADQVRKTAGLFFTQFAKLQTQDIGIVGFGARDEFRLRHAWKEEPSPRLPPIDKTVKWLSESIRALGNIIPFAQSEEKGRLRIDKIQLEKIDMKIRDNIKGRFRPVMSGVILAEVFVPFGFELAITEIRQSINMFRCTGNQATDEFPCGVKPAFNHLALVGRLESSWDRSNSTDRPPWKKSGFGSSRRYLVRGALNNSPGSHRDDNVFLRIQPQDQPTYQLFLRDVVVHKSVKTVIDGNCTSRIATGMGGHIEVADIPFREEILLDGFDGFRDTDSTPRLLVERNLAVTSVHLGGALSFRMDGAYLKRFGSGQVGLELDAPLNFELFHNPRRDDDNDGIGVRMGVVNMPSLNMGEFGNCVDSIHNPFTNETISAGSPVCAIAPIGTFEYPSSESNAETCEDRMACPGRSFLTDFLRGGPTHPVNITLKAVSGPPDLEKALPSVIMRNLPLPGYMHSMIDLRRAPFPIVRRIIVKPGRNIWDGKLWCWLEFYNPFMVPLRFFYINVNTYVGKTMIGKLQVNLTNYDPLSKKPGYVFPGYAKRAGAHPDKDPYGPHPSDKCRASGDCQIAPVDVPPFGAGGPACLEGYQPNTTLTRRLEVGFSLSAPGVLAFWRTLYRRNDDVRMNVTIAGQVSIAIGAPVFQGPARNDSDPNTRTPADRDPSHPEWRDPYLEPSDPTREPVMLTWLDYSQERTEMWFRKMASDDEIPRDPPFYPPECGDDSQA